VSYSLWFFGFLQFLFSPPTTLLSPLYKTNFFVFSPYGPFSPASPPPTGGFLLGSPCVFRGRISLSFPNCSHHTFPPFFFFFVRSHQFCRAKHWGVGHFRVPFLASTTLVSVDYFTKQVSAQDCFLYLMVFTFGASFPFGGPVF